MNAGGRITLGLAILGWSLNAAAAAAADGAVSRRPWLPLAQRTGGPLPLSVQHEVDAAIDRARLGLAAGLAESLPLRYDDAAEVAWPLTALLQAADPAVAAVRDRVLRQWLALRQHRRQEPERDAADQTQSAAALRLDALAAASQPTQARQDPDLPAALRQAAQQALSAALAALPDEASGLQPCATNLCVLLEQLDFHLDNLAMAQIESPFETFPVSSRTSALGRIDAALLRCLAAETDAARACHAQGLIGLARLRLSLGGSGAALPLPPETLARRLAPYWTFDPEGATDARQGEGWRAWRLLRLLNDLAPTVPLPLGQGASVDWRREIARQLISAQRIAPGTGMGFWGPVAAPPEGRRWQTTALCVLMLESL